MGANLNRLMQAYGVYTPTVSAYSGVDTPDALKAGATAAERGTYQGSLADYTAQQDAFKGYERDYKNRIATTDLYTSPPTASTFLSTPNYSTIKGMRANLSDTTSADTTDYTNPNFSSMVNDAYRSLGRVGIGTDTSNIDQPGYNYWMGQLQAGANGGITPSNFKNQFKTSTNDYIRQYPDNDYTKYIQGYLGLLPVSSTTTTVLPTTGGDTNIDDAGGANYRGGSVKSPKSMEDALLRDRSRHEFSDPSFEETYGKYFYNSGGDVSGTRTGVSSLLSSNNLANLPEVTSDPYIPDADPYTVIRAVSAPAPRAAASADRFQVASVYDPHNTTDYAYDTADYVPPAAASTGVDTTSSFSVPDARLGAVTPANPDRAQNSQNSQNIADLIKRKKDALDAYRKSLVDEPSSKETDPANVKHWWDLAAAMLAPTKTKQGFFEAASKYSEARGKGEQEAALRKTAAAKQKKEMTLENLKLDYNITDEELKSARQDDRDIKKAAHEIALKKMESPNRSVEASDIHMLLNGDPASRAYAGAYARQGAPRVMADGTVISPNMQAYTTPTFKPESDSAGGGSNFVTPTVVQGTNINRGVEASDIHMLLNGDPSSRAYAGAYARQGAPRVMTDGTVISPNMQAYTTPTFKPESDSVGGGNNYVTPTVVPGTKPIPPAVLKGMTENISAITQIDRTLQELKNTQGSGVGFFMGNLPGAIADRHNPEGVRLRAMIADIGSMKIHDRSGAAVTAAEFPRLRPFIPSPSDNPKTIREKLNQFRDQYLNELRDQRSVYGVSDGYKPVGAVDDILKKNEPRPESDNIIKFDRNGDRIPQ